MLKSIVLQPGGGREFYHGSETAQGVAAFAKEAAAATNFRTIGEEEFLSGMRNGGESLEFQIFHSLRFP